jgi:8-oxo-dGTP pyrophosphatase MutT (NUDIX family)
MNKLWLLLGNSIYFFARPGIALLLKNETPVAGVLREVREETGLTLNAMTLTDKGSFTCEDQGFKFHYQLFITRVMEPAPLSHHWLEIANAAWIPRHDIEQYKLTAEVTQALLFWPK